MGVVITRSVNRHVHKKIDRSEMKKKSYIGQCCSDHVVTASHSSLLDATVDLFLVICSYVAS